MKHRMRVEVGTVYKKDDEGKVWRLFFHRNGKEGIARWKKAKNEMWRILVKKKVCQDKAGRKKAINAIQQVMKIAWDHQLERSWWENSGRRTKTIADTEDLIARLERFAESISALPDELRRSLSAIVAKCTHKNFGAASFAALIHDIDKKLLRLDQKRPVTDVRDAIFEPVNYEPFAGVKRTADSELIDRWERLPPLIRINIGQIAWGSKVRRSAPEFFRHLVVLLKRFMPPKRGGRYSAFNEQFARRVAPIWRGLGLPKPGLAYGTGTKPKLGDDGKKPGNQDSSFQQFCNAALAGVGDQTKVARTQVKNISTAPAAKGRRRVII